MGFGSSNKNQQISTTCPDAIRISTLFLQPFPHLIRLIQKIQFIMRNISFFILIAAALASCNSTKNDLETNELTAQNADYLVFGKFFGHCMGECATLFKLDGTQLFADDMPRFNGWEDLKFKAEPLPDARVQAAKELLEAFPQELLNEAETIGCPDCADQGGFALEIRKDGTLHHWRIDTNKDQIPDYLKAYIEQLNIVVEKMKP